MTIHITIQFLYGTSFIAQVERRNNFMNYILAAKPIALIPEAIRQSDEIFQCRGSLT